MDFKYNLTRWAKTDKIIISAISIQIPNPPAVKQNKAYGDFDVQSRDNNGTAAKKVITR